MFCKKRYAGPFIGRLPLRNIDLNETLESEVKPSGCSNQKLTNERGHEEENKPSVPRPPGPITWRGTTSDSMGPKIEETGSPHLARTRTDSSSATTEQSTVTNSTPLSSQLSTLTINHELSQNLGKNTTNSTFPSIHDYGLAGNQTVEQKRLEVRVTPSSTFPISNLNPQSCSHTHNTPHCSKPPTPLGSTHKHELPSSSISHSKSLPQHSISAAPQDENGPQQSGVTPASRPPTNRQASIVSARKASTPSLPDSYSGVVSMNGTKYRKLCLIGSGGSSKVFKVLCSENFQIYALKEVYLRHTDQVIKEAFVNEIKLLKRLSNRREIITLHCFSYNSQEGVLYLLLEFAEMDLNAVIKDWNQANHMLNVLYFWNQILLAVKVIHEEGVVHNDLKPANFVVVGAELRLIDFGISQRIEAEKTSFERDMRCGTSSFMSPETIQFNEGSDCYKVGRPSDVWSLGCILYLMIYGCTPFDHIKGQLNRWNAIVSSNHEIHFPHIANEAAIDIMKKCLRRNPKERPTIDELIAHPFSCNTPM